MLAGRRGDAGEVGVLGPGVDDDVERALGGVLGGTADHQVVGDAAVGGQQQGVAVLAALQTDDVPAHQRLHQGGHRTVVGLRVARGRVQPQEGWAHVGDIEQAGVLAGPAVLAQDAFILHRHVVAAERHQLAARQPVGGVERGALQGNGAVQRLASSTGVVTVARAFARPAVTPAVMEPERFQP